MVWVVVVPDGLSSVQLLLSVQSVVLSQYSTL